MNASRAFQPARNQDACATIRGFHYQVDHTILRWLALGPDEHLELECGEDIDIVVSAMAESDDNDFDRRLEQVKLRATKLTLRSSEALEALSNAVGHHLENPLSRLQFCFTTNALVTRERPSPFPGKMFGIELWNQIRVGALPQNQIIPAIELLRQFLVAAARPKKVAATAWSRFIEFFKNQPVGLLAAFIRSFEWSFGQPNAADLSDEVCDKLRDRAATKQEDVNDLYDRLFLFVFRMLAQPAAKRLTLNELESQLSATALTDTDRVFIRRLHSRFDALEGRVDELEETVDGFAENLKRLSAEHGIGNLLVDAAGLVTTDVPLLADALSNRTKTVKELVTFTSRKAWLAINGFSDTGKTHLALLVAKAKGPSCGWIRFHSLMPLDQALATLVESLRRISGFRMDDRTSGTNSYQRICSTFQVNSCLVLDDLPNLNSPSLLAQHLQLLADACRARGVFLISTSHFRLPSGLVHALGEAMLELTVPHFSDEEAAELLLAHGAPRDFLADGKFRFINSLSAGHPLLLTLAGQFLQNRSWLLDNDEFSALMRGDHTQAVADEVLARVAQSLTDSQRELLYRMALAICELEENDAIALAGVEDSIQRPKECIATLLGAWVQRDTNRTLVVSPLVKTLGDENLASKTLLGCHRVLGESITRRPMSPWDAEIAIDHFRRAKEFDKVGSLWMKLLDQFARRKFESSARSVLLFLERRPLPPEMSVELRVSVRAMQLRVMPKYGMSLDAALADLDLLVPMLDPKHGFVAEMVGALAALFLVQHDFTRAARYLSQSLGILRLSESSRDKLRLPRQKGNLDLLWTLIVHIKSLEHIEAWLSAFDSLAAHEQQAVMNSKDAILGCRVLSDRLMTIEMDVPKQQQNWLQVVTRTQWLQEEARQRQWEYLEACSAATVINIYGEFLRVPDIGVNHATAFLTRPNISELASGFVAGMVGKMFAFANRHVDAILWLRRAIVSPDSGLHHDRMMTLLAAAKCMAAEDPLETIRFANQAATIARTSKTISDLEAAKAFGEHALAILGLDPTSESALRAYPAWLEAATRLLGIAERDRDWKELFVLFSHVQNYLTSLAMTGEAPNFTATGEVYAAPSQGMFFLSHPQRADYFREELAPGVMWLLSQYAWRAGDEASATLWQMRAAEETEGQPMTLPSAMILKDRIPGLLCSDSFDTVFDIALRTQLATNAALESIRRGEFSVASIPPIEELVPSLSDEGRRQAEQFALIVGAIPALIRLGTVATSDRTRALTLAAEASSLCNQTAMSAGDPALWQCAAAIFDAVAKEAKSKECLQLANSFADSECLEIRYLGYMATAIQGNAEMAFRAHLVSMQQLLIWIPPDSAAHSKILLPYLEQFWKHALERSRFHFRSPSEIEASLSTAFSAEPAVRAVEILKALLPAFNVADMNVSIQWLNSQPHP